MRWFTPLIGIVLILSLAAGPSAADDTAKDSPWAKFSFNAGAFLSSTATDVRFGSGLGVTINLEEAFGLEATNRVFRLDTYWRFTDNRRHRVDFSWFSLKRSAYRKLTDDITINPPNDDEITLETGAEVESFIDLDIFEIDYRYSFIQDERLDMAGGIGLYVMPISFGLNVTGIVDEQGDQAFTAPLPVLSLKIDVLIAPKWYFRNGAQLFYVEYDGMVGSVTNLRSGLEYNPWKHFGLGVGVESMRLYLEGNGQIVYPDNDLKGTVGFNYFGLNLYGRVYF
jgi:hypothetical protein